MLLGRGDGTFTVQLTVRVGGNNPRAVAVGDFNGDGRLDLVTANVVSNDVSVLRATAMAPLPPSSLSVWVATTLGPWP